jgi:hypothetical protein
MATFKLGQRVRVVQAGLFPEVIGKEATIMGLPGDNPKYPQHYNIAVDNIGRAMALPHCLEPLKYDGDTKITWAEMEDLWSPDRLKATT